MSKWTNYSKSVKGDKKPAEKKKNFTVRQKIDKYKGDVAKGKRTKANSFRKGYLTAANDIGKQYDVKKK